MRASKAQWILLALLLPCLPAGAFNSDVFDIALMGICPDGSKQYLVDVSSGPGPCLGVVYDGQPHVCGTHTLTGANIEVSERQTVNGSTDVTVRVQADDGSDLLPFGFFCGPGQPIGVLAMILAKPDSGGPGLPGDPLDPGLTPSPTQATLAETIVFGAGNTELLRVPMSTQGSLVANLEQDFSLFGADSVVITALEFHWNLDGTPVANGLTGVIFPDAVSMPAGRSQLFHHLDCPTDASGDADMGPDGIPATSDDSCTPSPADFSTIGDIGTISDTTGTKTRLDADAPAGAGQVQGALVANVEGQVRLEADIVVREAAPGLTVVKRAQETTVGLGAEIVYTIQVRAGPEGTAFVELQDFLPANGERFLSLLAPGWTCMLDSSLVEGELIQPVMPFPREEPLETSDEDEPDEDLNWSRPHFVCTFVGVLDPNQDAPPITLTLRAGSVPGFPRNRVKAAGVGGFAEDTEVVEVTDAVDLAARKQGQPNPVEADQLIRYTIVVDNVGVNPAASIEVVDTLPASYQVVGQEGDSLWSCSPRIGDTIRCTYLGSVNPGASTGPLVLVVQPPMDSSSGTSFNVAEVSDTETEDNDDLAPAPVTVLPVADIFVVKRADRTQVRVDTGDPLDRRITYTLRVHNIGPGPAEDVVVTDTLPPGVTFISGPPNCTHQNGVVSCDLGDIPPPPDNVREVDIIVEVDPARLGETICNRASVTTSSVDRFPSNDTSDDVCTRAVPTVELDLTKTRITSVTQVGVPIFYEVIVRNPSADVPADDVVMTDLLPLSGISDVTASASQGSCDVQLANSRVVCGLGKIPPGGSARVIIGFTPTLPGQYCDTATVSADALPPGGDAPQVCDDVELGPDVAVFKRFVPDPADPVLRQGIAFQIELVATNGGTAPVENVQLRDALPPGMDFIGFTQGSAGCQFQSGQVDCNLGTLAAGQSAVVRFAVRYSGSGTLCNDAQVTTSTPQPTFNDATQTCADFAPTVDLRLVKTGPPRFVGLGQRFEYTLEVTNTGPGDATGVQVTDLVPANLALVSASFSRNGGPEQPCFDQGGDAGCDVLAVAEGDTVIVQVTVDSLSTGEGCDRGDVTAAEFERNIEDNRSDYCNEVIQGLADLEVEKSGPTVQVVLGQVFSYTIRVTNRGPDTATGVVLEDDLAFELGLDDARFSRSGDPPGSSTACGFDPATRRVSCAIGALASGEVATVTIRVVPQFADVEFCNGARGDLNEFDPDPTDNVSPRAGEAPLCHTALADRDGDGVPDVADNCPDFPNPAQADVDGNGIGDLCECGDQNGDGVVNVADLIAINLAIFNPALVTPLCDTNNDGECDVRDLVGTNLRIFGRPATCSRHPR